MYIGAKVNLDDILPICADYSIRDGNIWRINLAGMKKHSPTGDNWGYAPFLKTYKTEEEAKLVRMEIFKTMKRFFGVPSKKLCEKEADKRYAGASFGNDRNIFLEGALFAIGE
jgi:hypothetical protein